MTRISWQLVEVLSRTLEPGERDVVLGDFAESVESGGRALRGVLGLVLRRQAALWDWRPWAALVGLIVPLGMMLSIVARLTAGGTDTYTWLYANNWDLALLRYREFWYEFNTSVVFVFVSWLTLVCWSWTAGFTLGSLSRRKMTAYGVLFCLTLVLGGLIVAPLYHGRWLQANGRPPSPDEHDPISAYAFYQVMLPLIVQAVLVLVPAVWGIRRGADMGGYPRLLRVGLWTAAIGTFVVLIVREPGLAFFLRAHWLLGLSQRSVIRLLQFVAYWPVPYVVTNAMWRHWHAKTAA
jgi:hypothetical protein